MEHNLTQVTPFIIDKLNEFEQENLSKMTILSALDCVQESASNAKNIEKNNVFSMCENELSFLTQKLLLNKNQVLMLALFLEENDSLTIARIAQFLGISRLSAMNYANDLNELVKLRWVVKSNEQFGEEDKYFLETEAAQALCRNEVFVPQNIRGLNELEFANYLENRVNKMIDVSQYGHYDYENEEVWMRNLVDSNPSLPLCKEILQLKDLHAKSLLLLITAGYIMSNGSLKKGVSVSFIKSFYEKNGINKEIIAQLQVGSHELIKKGLIEYFTQENNFENSDGYKLTTFGKHKFLSSIKEARRPTSVSSFCKVIRHGTIQPKELFFNSEEQKYIDDLTKLLGKKNYNLMQHRLEKAGMRKGLACLFYGEPGTGKTESVIQIARRTHRDLIQVDFSQLRDKYIGESEKNVKEIFDNYRQLCSQSQVKPILFFNEADAILGKRLNDTRHSSDKMENSIVNIILQEVEQFDGILLATTNLICNMDEAMERRFLYKILFSKPNEVTKTKIWKYMLGDITDEEAACLARHYDFSGGQIENISRKRTISHILTGEKATIDDIEEFCQTEAITFERRNKHINIVGFDIRH